MVSYLLPTDWLDYLGLGIDVAERIYIELNYQEGQEKEFQRFVNTLYFVIDAVLTSTPGAGGGGLAMRSSHEVAVAGWRATPNSVKLKIQQQLAKRMGWSIAKAAQMTNVFFSEISGGGGGNSGNSGTGNTGSPQEPKKTPAPSPTTVSVSEKDANHIFRNTLGHLPVDTPANRQLLINTASNPKNYLGVDKYGTQWYSEIRPDGTQVWVQLRNGQIRDGGLNQTPKPWDPNTELKKPTKP